MNARITSRISTVWRFLTLALCAGVVALMPATATSIIPVRPTFDMQWSTDRALYVLRLTFDPKAGIAVNEVLKAGDEVPAQWKIDEIALNRYLASVGGKFDLKIPVEMIAFLRVENEGTWDPNLNVKETPKPFDRTKLIDLTLRALYSYGHPRHIPMLLDWGLDGNAPHAQDAMWLLPSLTGLTIPVGDRQAWRTWWERNKRVLDPEYDLRTAAGINVWLDASAKAEPDVQKILLKLWEFEPAIDEPTLIKIAGKNPLARTVLAKLWSDDRLSVEARKTIVRNHLSFHLEQVPATPDETSKNRYRVRIAATADFPFPSVAYQMIEYNGAIALNGEPVLANHQSVGFHLSDILNKGRSPFVTGVHGDRVVAHALVQVREGNENAPVWELEWQPEPLEVDGDPE